MGGLGVERPEIVRQQEVGEGRVAKARRVYRPLSQRGAGATPWD